MNLLIEHIIHIGQDFHRQGWAPATSGNYSARLSDATIVITASGPHKGHLTAQDFLRLRRDGTVLDSSQKPSAETALHLAIYEQFSDAQCILHTHSPLGVVLSQIEEPQGFLRLHNYELLKALKGITSHEEQVILPIIPNSQDMSKLSQMLHQQWAKQPRCYGFLIAGHGLYSWGTSTIEAQRHIECLETLFHYEYLKRHLKGAL